MTLQILQETLERGLNVVKPAVANRPSLPVLSHILLRADTLETVLAANDLETFIVARIAAKVGSCGALTLPARLFGDLVSALPPEKVEINLADGVMHLVCGNSDADIRGIDAQEFPLLPEVEEDREIGVAPYDLRLALSQVVFAAATDESRPILTGVLLKFDGATLTMAAADGFRLAVRTLRLDLKVPEPFDVIVPAKALGHLGKLLGEEEEGVAIYVPKVRNQVTFRLNGDAGANTGRVLGIDVTSQVIEGNFVNYRQILPKAHTTMVTVNTTGLLNALRTTVIFARSSANVTHLKADPEHGTLTLSAIGAETGESDVVLEARVEGEPLTIAFNCVFLKDAIGAIDSVQTILEFNGATNPGVIKPAGASYEYTSVIMPLHVRG